MTKPPPAPTGTDHDHHSPLHQDVLRLRQILRQWDEIDRVILLASTQEGHWAKDLTRQLGMTAGGRCGCCVTASWRRCVKKWTERQPLLEGTNA